MRVSDVHPMASENSHAIVFESSHWNPDAPLFSAMSGQSAAGRNPAGALGALGGLAQLVEVAESLPAALLLQLALDPAVDERANVWFAGRGWRRFVADEIQAAFRIGEGAMVAALDLLERKELALTLLYRNEAGVPDLMFLSPEPDAIDLAWQLCAPAAEHDTSRSIGVRPV